MKVPYKVKLTQDSVPLYTGAGTEYMLAGSVSEREQLVIDEERKGNGAVLWGRLKSGAGWIPLDDTEAIADPKSILHPAI